jgi:hypothetical protein
MADDTPSPNAGSIPVVVLEPRFKRVMPWTLVLLAIALAVYAAHLQKQTTIKSRVTVKNTPALVARGFWWGGHFYTYGQRKLFESRERARGGHINAMFYAEHPTIEKIFGMRLLPTPGQAHSVSAGKVTTTETGPSDTLVDFLFGLAAVLLLGGAFFTRITKISLPGGAGLEMGAVAIDFKKIEEEVARQVQQAIQEKPAAERPSAEEAAAIGVQATARAQQSVLQVRLAVAPLAAPQPVTVETRELAQARRGMPLPDELVKRLAENAVQEVLQETTMGSG